MFFAALGTDARKLQLIACDAAAGSGFLQYALGQGYMFQIQNLTAGCADKVGVGFGIVVKPFQTVDNADGLDGTFFLEHGDVPVDGAQAEIGEAGLELPVDPFGSGVAFGASDAVQNGIALFTVLSDNFHSFTSKLVMIIVTIIILT